MSGLKKSSDAKLGDEPLPEPEYDHLDFSFQDDDNLEIDGSPQKSNSRYSEYILGTLIVRVVAARDIEPVHKGGLGKILFGNKRSSRDLRSRSRNAPGVSVNPYASVRYCGQSQRTTEVYDTTDPIWPRGETMFFDVSLPVVNVVQELPRQTSAAGTSNREDQSGATSQLSLPPPPKPILTVALFHATGTHAKLDKYPTKSTKGKGDFGDSDDPFLGVASVDVTSVLTGKSSSIDEWLPLVGTENSSGRLRIVCEYDASDPPPRPGDKLRFSSYCPPAALYPVPPNLISLVEEVDGDDLILSYNSPEGWLCSFSGHRFMFLCEERYQGAIETYQQELANFTERLAFSPLVSTVKETVERVPDNGLLFLGVDVVRESASVLTRWLKGGVGTAVQDIVYATNLDGRFNPDHLYGDDSSNSAEEQEEEESIAEEDNDILPDDLAVSDDELPDDAEPIAGMPCCPITGEPMRDPVVAADGHTYERSAITRWLQTSDTSPLTGSVLPHKNLVTNYVLVSSLQGAAASAATLEETEG